MRRPPAAVLACGLAVCAGCATPGAATAPGPDAAIPVFAADDPRVNTGGFVRETLRLHEERDDTRYTLMAFAVGDILTLGAMVRGSFAGAITWRIDGRELSLPFDTAASLADVPVSVRDEPGLELRGQGAAFRGTSWVNVELPLASWGSAGTALQLTFEPRTGEPVTLPDDGHHYVVRHVAR